MYMRIHPNVHHKIDSEFFYYTWTAHIMRGKIIYEYVDLFLYFMQLDACYRNYICLHYIKIILHDA